MASFKHKYPERPAIHMSGNKLKSLSHIRFSWRDDALDSGCNIEQFDPLFNTKELFLLTIAFNSRK
jgi:hypothetical protein